MPRKKGKTVRVGAAQMISEEGDAAANIEKALGFCDLAAARGVQILCLPEAASTGFGWVKNKRHPKVYTEPVPGPMVRRFAKKAAEKDLYIIMGMVERPARSKKRYNTAFLVGPSEGYIGKYRKIFAERVFEPGREAPVFETRHGRIGMFICADMRSPEITRLLMLKGATILFQPTNYFHAEERDPEKVRRRYLGKVAAQRCRAVESGLPLVIANAGRPEYVNNSRIVAPNGQGPAEHLARATRKEQLITADLEVDRSPRLIGTKLLQRSWLFEELAREMRGAVKRNTG